MASSIPIHHTTDIGNTPTVASQTDASPVQAALAAGPIIAAILQWLPLVQRCRLLSVNRAWRAAGDDPDAWAGLTLKQRQMGLIAACRGGGLALVRKRITVFGLRAVDIRAQNNRVFHAAVRSGNLATVEWLARYCGLTRNYDNISTIQSFLYLASERGHLATIQWMVTYFNLTSAEVRASLAGYIACVNGYLSIVKWLAAHFHLTAADIHVDIALRQYCLYNHLPTVEWLVDHFSLTAADLQMMLLNASSNGIIGLVQWVVSRFGLTIDDMRGTHLTALNCAAYNGQLAVVQWIVAHFHLSAINIRDGKMLYWAACRRSQLAVVQWLVNHFGIAIADENLLDTIRDKECECGEPLTPAEEWLAQYCDRNRQSD